MLPILDAAGMPPSFSSSSARVSTRPRADAITKLEQVDTATHPAALLLPRGKPDGREL